MELKGLKNVSEQDKWEIRDYLWFLERWTLEQLKQHFDKNGLFLCIQ
jgi:hypothetical protein